MKLRTLVLGIIAFLAIRYAFREGVRSVLTSATTDHAAKCLVMHGYTTSFQGIAALITPIQNLLVVLGLYLQHIRIDHGFRS